MARVKDDLQVGDPKLTVKLRNQYGKERVESESSGDGSVGKWEDWLDEGGYGLDSYGHAYRKSK